MEDSAQMNELEYEVWETIVNEFCEGCKGQLSIKEFDGECWKNCDGFKEAYEECLNDWKSEMTVMTEPETVKHFLEEK